MSAKGEREIRRVAAIALGELRTSLARADENSGVGEKVVRPKAVAWLSFADLCRSAD
jgi:hypothetical protein